MIQATLQIKTNFRQAPRGKTLAVVKGPSGKPILLCSLAPRFKQRKERGEPRGAKPLPKRSAAIAGGAIAPRFALFNSIAAETHFENVTNNVLLPNSPQLSFPSLYSDQRALGSVLLKCLRRNFDPRVRHKLLAPDAKLLGLRLAQACILKGIQTVDVVIQEYTLSAYLLLQGLRMGGVRFNRFRILQAVDSSQNLMGKQMDLGKRASPHLKHERATLKPWLLDVSPKEELLRTLTKSRLIKTLTRHTFWQARSLKYKMDKLLSRKSRRGDIREQLNFSQTQKEAVKKWRAFTNLGTLLSVRAKEQAVGRSGGRTKWGAIAPPTKFKTTKWGAIAPSTKFKTTKWGATAPPKSPRGTIVPHFVHAPPTAPRAVAPRFATPPKRGGTKWGTNEVGGDSLPIVPTFVGGGEAKKTGFAPPLYSVPSYRLDRSFAPFIPKSFSKKLSLSQKARSPAGGDSPPNKLTKRAAGFKPKRMSKLAGSKRKPQFAITQTRFIANIQNTLNNTIITITDRSGNTKLWCSSGSIGLKASRRSTNYAAQSVAEVVAKKCRKLGIRRVEARVQGVGYGKPSALKGLKIGGLLIRRIVDTTPKPHNGCRAPKQRRV